MDFEPWPEDDFVAWDDSVVSRRPQVQPKATDPRQCRHPQPLINLGGTTPSLAGMCSGLHRGAQPPPRPTSYSLAGADPDNVKNRLKHASCKCKRRLSCHKQVNLKELLTVCSMIWSISALERGMLLRNEYMAGQTLDSKHEEDSTEATDVEGKRMRRTQWHLCRAPVCFPTFCHLLRMGPVFIRNSIHGVPNVKSKVLGQDALAQPKKAPQTEAVDWFFQELYQSAAEALPEDPECAVRDGHKSQSSAGDDFIPWDEESDECSNAKRRKVAASSSQGPSTSAVQQCSRAAVPPSSTPSLFLDPAEALTVASATKVTGLPVRYIQHCNVSDLYWQLVAAWDVHAQHVGGNNSFESGCPHYSTFLRRWRSKWEGTLKMRKSSQHSQCQTCFELQMKLRSQASWEDKLQAARDLRQHYTLQYEDRCLYWSFRWVSRMGGDILCIIIDGMDKAKFSWPRWPFQRLPKDMEGKNRPRSCLNAVMAHGYCTRLFLQDDKMEHGSNGWCEMISQTIESVRKICKDRGKPMPRHLVIQADNTTGQCKNQYGTQFLAFLVCSHKFMTCTLNFLMVGHTHEDIDQLFSVVLWIMLAMKTFQSPEELLKGLAKGLRERVVEKGEILEVTHLTAIRNFAKWLDPFNLHLTNAFGTRGGIEAPHCFIFKFGVLLTTEERRLLEQQELHFHANAVYACVKTYMRDQALQDAPVYLVRAGQERQVLMESPVPREVLRRAERSKDEIKDIAALARLCRNDLDLPRAAEALQSLLQPRHIFTPQLAWLEAHTAGDPTWALPVKLRDPQYPHLPKTSWHLVASQRHKLPQRGHEDAA